MLQKLIDIFLFRKTKREIDELCEKGKLSDSKTSQTNQEIRKIAINNLIKYFIDIIFISFWFWLTFHVIPFPWNILFFTYIIWVVIQMMLFARHHKYYQELIENILQNIK